MIPDKIYLDYAASTPVSQEVINEMLPFFNEHFGNASSVTHQHGWYANGAIKKARKQVDKSINCEESEIIFTSGATEGINLAIRGVYQRYSKKGNHIVVCKTEHKAVLDTVEALEKEGASVSYIDVDHNGMINLESFKNALQPTTVLVAIMWVNNETGVIQDIDTLSKIAFEHNIPFLCDGTQAVGKIPINMETNAIGIMPISAHKFFGPKGIGALYIRRKNPRISLSPLITGGAQEKKLRAGTLNTPAIVGLGEAINRTCSKQKINHQKLTSIRLSFKEFFKTYNARFNESIEHCSPHILNITLPGIKTDHLLKQTRGLSYSLGSACTSETLDPSHVLSAMGLSKEDCFCSFRLSFSPYMSQKDILKSQEIFKAALTNEYFQ